jgi:molybdopterin/thiamine biosynthesis adenylyltransferase
LISESDEGTIKSDVIAQRLREMNPNVAVETVKGESKFDAEFLKDFKVETT